MRPLWYSRLAGLLTSAIALGLIVYAPVQPGLPETAKLEAPRFSVALLTGLKQAAQNAPETAEVIVDAVVVTPQEKTAEPAVADREAALPNAVLTAPAPAVAPQPEPARPVEVTPPARVSMPGGRLVVEEAPAGEAPDPFAIGPRQVYLRLTVDAAGKVIGGGIVRAGPEPWRDAMIFRAMRSRVYATQNLLRLPSEQGLWQLDLVIDYGHNDVLP